MLLSPPLLRHRLAHGWTQAELARRSGIAQPNLAAYERGRRVPSLRSLARLARALEAPPGSLMEERRPDAAWDRHDFDGLCRALLRNEPGRARLPPRVWNELAALFHRKLRALRPRVSRRRPRIRAGAALRRLKARYSPEFVGRMVMRLEKPNLGGPA